MAARQQQRQPGVRGITSRHSLPSEWDRRHWGRHQHVQEYLKVDGLAVKYVGPGESDAQAATIFADHPVPSDVPLYYYEVTVVNQGDHGYIGIGFCADTVNLGRLPGWEPHSYGWHGDDGHAFHGSGQGRPFGPGYGTGDVVGALLDRGRNTISYYKNGEHVGVAFLGVKEPQLYPCVGMRTKHEEVRANFGATPFVTNLDKLHAEFRDRVLADIMAVPLPATVELPLPQGKQQQQPQQPQPPQQQDKQQDKQQEQQQQQEEQPGGAASRQAHTAYLQALVRARFAGGSAAVAAVAGGSGSSAQQQQQQQPGAAGAAGAAPGAPAGTSAAAAAADAGAAAAASGGGGKSQRPVPTMPHLIFDYLLHCRCWQTAAVVARDMLVGPAAEGAQAAAASAAAASPSTEGGAAATAAAAGGGGDGDGDTPMAEGGASGGGGGGAAAAAAGGGDHPMPDAGGPGSAGGAAAAGAGGAAPGGQPQPAVDGGTAAAAPGGGDGALAGVVGLSQADIQDALQRQRIYDTICAGRIAEALVAVQEQYGAAALEGSPRLAFKLRVQQFVELVRQASGGDAAQEQQQQQQQHASNGSVAAAAAAAEAEGGGAAGSGSSSGSGGAPSFEAALAYGRAELGPCSKGPQDEELLSDALSLLAYADPAASPCGHLLRESHRAELAEEVNGALLKARGSSGRPLLETMYRQAVVLVDELKRQGLPASLVLDVVGLCCEPPPAAAAPAAAGGSGAAAIEDMQH